MIVYTVILIGRKKFQILFLFISLLFYCKIIIVFDSNCTDYSECCLCNTTTCRINIKYEELRHVRLIVSEVGAFVELKLRTFI